MPSDNPNCVLCPLHETARTVCVSGTGPANAEIMFVGEAPGRNEDERGIPFIGRAGEVLDELLTEYGFRREDVRITNAVRCRPPDAYGKDRTPSVKEMKACRDYLIAEVQSVRPSIVVALGNTALRTLTGNSGISKARGDVRPLHADFRADAGVLPTFHPSATFHYLEFKDQIREDLALLRRTVDGNFNEIAVPWEWCNDELTAVKIADVAPVIVFDLETNARETRDPFSHVYLCALDDGRGPVRVFRNIELAKRHLCIADWTGNRVVGHNSSRFDRLMLKALHGENVKCDDTMLMAWLLHEEWGVAKRLNLESLCVTLLGLKPWKKDVTWDWRTPATIPWEKAGEYNARDTKYTRELYFHLKPKLEEQGLYTLYDRLLLRASRALADMEERGLWINEQNVYDAITYYELKSEEHLDYVHGHAGEYGMADFNLRSPKQVAELLFERMGLPPVRYTDHGAASTNAEALKTLREDLREFGGFDGVNIEIFDALLNYRKAQKMIGTYLRKFLRQRDMAGMVYPWYSLTNTVTGRTSGDYQQIPREPRTRRSIGAPPGKLLMSADYSQLELRMAASKYCFDEPNLRAAFERGDDVHLLLASEITGKPLAEVTKEERARAKPPNFLFLYGGEEDMYTRTLLEDYDIVKRRETATYERDAFFRRWNALPAGHLRVVQELEASGQVRSMLGGIRRLPSVYSPDRKVKVEAYRQGINFKDQNPACHIALTGLVLLMGAGFDVRSFQHDAYLLWVDDDREAVLDAAARVRYLLEVGVPAVLRSEFGIDFDVPLKADLTAGTAWTDDDRLCEHGEWLHGCHLAKAA